MSIYINVGTKKNLWFYSLRASKFCDLNFSKFIAPMNYFQRLPEGCILEILSRTTPVDAVRSCILSRGFKTALESEIIWERFLPSDYQEIIERSEFPPVCTTKKELYFNMCECPILLDGGKLVKTYFEVVIFYVCIALFVYLFLFFFFFS